ncbi:MAG TPA: hypothetical protein VHH33_05430 [Nitrososphaeraceae archaeon]|nr:hypothetical protein [Nitrososphaeraceae archaeon]
MNLPLALVVRVNIKKIRSRVIERMDEELTSIFNINNTEDIGVTKTAL